MNLLKKCRYGMMIYNNSDIWIGRSLEKYGEFSESEVQLFREVVKPGSVVVDIGANIGCHSLALSKIVGPMGVVFAYEPERHNFNTLCGNMAINNVRNVFCFQKALGAASGTIAVPELDMEKTVNFGGLSLTEDYSGGVHYAVPLTTIDETNFLRLDFLKIDIEGMEKFALEGGAQTIKKLKPHMYVENDREDKSKDLIDYIKSLDYIVYKHLAPMYNPNNFFEDSENVFLSKNNEVVSHIVSGNVFCHHKDVPCPIDSQKFGMELI
jgi:FkbM family methyltransferase